MKSFNSVRLILLVILILAVPATVAARPPQKKAPQKKTTQLKTSVTAHSVGLTWAQATVSAGATCPTGTGSTAVTSNAVYRGTTAGGESSAPLAVLTPPATAYTDAAVTAGVTYFYQITGSNCAGESPRSNEASAGPIPNPVPPNAPVQNPPTVQ